MKKNISISISIILLSIIVSFIIFDSHDSKANDPAISENIEIVVGTQYITINARGGYSPKVSDAKASIPTKLIIKTDETYDCSISLVIRSIDYQKILEVTGEEIIDMNEPEVGQILGMCSMGMYNFTVNFN